VAPRILGKGIEAVGDLGISEIARTVKLSPVRVYRKGVDLIVEAEILS
jgi:hypothetical protein